jgi:arylamine N-acetyltransferase
VKPHLSTLHRDDMRPFHNILLVFLEGETYLVDVGFSSSSPR